jgi:chemotaxis receptor (MCP) glutamine deamidase CheD
MEVGQDIGKGTLEEIQDSDEYTFVGVNTFGITKADSENPVLKTIYLNTCVGLVLYDRDTQVAGLAHIVPTGERKIREHIKSMVGMMEKHGFNSQHEIDVHLVGSWENVSDHVPDIYIADTSMEEVISQLKKVIGEKFNLLTEEKTRGKPHDIAFDSRNGILYHVKEAKYPSMGVAEKFRALVNPPKGAWITPDKRSLR